MVEGGGGGKKVEKGCYVVRNDNDSVSEAESLETARRNAAGDRETRRTDREVVNPVGQRGCVVLALDLFWWCPALDPGRQQRRTLFGLA